MAKTLLQILLLGAMLWPGLVVPARSEAAAADNSGENLYLLGRRLLDEGKTAQGLVGGVQ